MASVQHCVLLLTAVLSMVCCVPIPGGLGGHDHTHFIIHVPHHTHTIHHTHVKKIYVPVHKEVYLKEPPINHGWAHGGWHGSHSGW